MKENRKNFIIKHSDIKKALTHLALDSGLAVVQKNQYALEAIHLDCDYILLTIYKEIELGSQQYFYYADYKVAKNILMELLYV